MKKETEAPSKLNRISKKANFLFNTIFIILSFICIIPVIFVFMISVTSEDSLIRNGYQFIPKVFSASSYLFLWGEINTIVKALGISVLVTVAVASKFIDTIVSNNTVRGSLNAISASSPNPEKCLAFLQLINLDSKVRDAFYYGLEGENFKYTDNGEIERINNDWSMAGYTQGTFFTVSKLATDEINQWEEVKELNANANPSVLLGFNLDTSKIENELANCRSVYEKYRSELMTGARDPRELVKTITTELDAAGFKTIVTEAQVQIDAAFAK